MADAEKVRERQDGGYSPPIITEPRGGPVPPWTPPEDVPVRKAQG